MDCYKASLGDPVYSGEFANVFKGYYQERSVAVKVAQLYSNDRDVILRVSFFVVLDSCW